jgi:adenosine kinase
MPRRMSALICGSLAYDTIMVFQDQFKNHILPDKVHILNVSFLVPRMRREFGGCAGNIAYNLKLLGGDPIPMATVGQDFGPYREHFDRLRHHPRSRQGDRRPVHRQAFITTDLDDNQITAFHPGAMMRSYENHVRDVAGVKFGIVGPDGYEAMLQNSKEFAELGIPFIFDPGQAMPLYNGKELRR